MCSAKPSTEPADLVLQARLRRDVITIVSQRDIQFAKELAKGADGLGDSALNSLDGGISMDTVFFLLRLRAQNEPMANQMFLQVLNLLPGVNCIEPESLILLATYVFTFPGYADEPNLTPTIIKYIGIGSVMLPDIRAERAEVSRQLMLRYLEATASVLSNSVCASQSRAQLYAASYLLLVKAQRLAPELSLRIATSMQGLRNGVPPEMLEDSTYNKVEANSQKGLAETLAEIENKSGVEYRDAQYFALVFDLWRKSDFEKARSVSSRISDAHECR